MVTKRSLRAVAPRDDDSEQRPADLRVAVASALSAMPWLRDSDEALRTLAIRQAEEIEKAVDRAELLRQIEHDATGMPDVYKQLQQLRAMCDVTKTVGWLGPQLQGVLRDLGGAPASRKAMQVDKPIGGRLAQLRADDADSGLDDS